MQYLRIPMRGLALATFALIALLLTSSPVSAQDAPSATFTPADNAFSNLAPGQYVAVPWTLTLPAGNYDVEFRIADAPLDYPSVSQHIPIVSNSAEPQTFEGTFEMWANPTFQGICASNNQITFESLVLGTVDYGSGPEQYFERISFGTFPCSVEAVDIQVSPDVSAIVQNQICGIANDELNAGQQPTGVGSMVSGWNDAGVATVTFFPNAGFYFPGGLELVHYFTDGGDCVTESPIPPTQTAICGSDNDEIVAPDAPANISMTQSSAWSVEHTWTVTYTPDAGYVLPQGFAAEHVFADPSPCIVAPVLPETAVAVCGEDNDIVTVPVQPTGVLVSDPGWANGERAITFTPDVDNGFGFQDIMSQVFTAQDENIPCEVDPVSKQVTVIFTTSDGGSIEGTPYQIFAPVASQVAQPAFGEGVIGPDNRIVVEGLVAGDYRLVTAPDGYGPIDTVLSVTNGTDPQEFSIQVVAIQVPASPSPEPTVAPTIEPTVSPTIEPTVAPTAATIVAPTQIAVTGLPETGTGTQSPAIAMALVSTIAATLILMVGGLRRR